MFLTAILALSVFAGLVSCDNDDGSDLGGETFDGFLAHPGQGNPSDGEDGNKDDEIKDDAIKDDGNASKPFSIDLTGYVANIGNATAIGIARNTNEGDSSLAVYGKAGVQFLSNIRPLSAKDTEHKNYIVMTTEEYDANAPEADKNGLTKVTFTKTVTENVTTETTGTKYIVANNGEISIAAVKDFTYSVYDGDNWLLAVRDNEPGDANDQTGVILVNNLTDGVEYRVEYFGVGEEITITQDDIDGEIDKLYVANGYTFISFVPEGQVQRPEASDNGAAKDEKADDALKDEGLPYDENGIAYYDKMGYFSSATRQSFVIDNATGYVYPIKDVEIEKLENNLVMISGKVFDMRVANNGDLEFIKVVQNETLTVYHYFKDIYGNKYIHNDFLDATDTANNTLYYTNKYAYLYSRQGVVIHRVCNEHGSPNTTTSVKKIVEGFEEAPISLSDEFVFDRYNVIKDSWLYLTFCYGNYTRINVESMVEEYGGQNEPISENVSLVDYKTMVVFLDNNLYYGDVWGANAVYPNGITNGMDASKLHLLLENVTREGYNSAYDSFETWRFRKTTITETIFYKITVGDDGIPRVIDETYTAPQQEIITLQPINK